MNAKLSGKGIYLGEELLRGKKAEVDKLVHVNRGVGSDSSHGGWGLGSSRNGQRKDRFAEAHEKEFAKWVNGLNAISDP